jgi:hypothetical protein
MDEPTADIGSVARDALDYVSPYCGEDEIIDEHIHYRDALDQIAELWSQHQHQAVILDAVVRAAVEEGLAPPSLLDAVEIATVLAADGDAPMDDIAGRAVSVALWPATPSAV